MKITIPKILGRIPLADYAPELGEQALTVWLNPPSGLLREYYQAFDRVADRNTRLRELPESAANKKIASQLIAENEPDVTRMLEVVSELLSAGPEETRVSPAELNEMIETLADANPGFYIWVVNQAFDQILQYRMAQKKS